MADLVNKNKYEQENKLLYGYLNQVVGILVFTISLTCLSFENSQKAAAFSLPVILAILRFTPRVKELKLIRELIRDHDNETEKKELKEEFEKFIKADSGFFKSLLDIPIFYYAMIFYIIVLICPDFGVWFRK